MKRGLYIHIPFCHRRCHYCDFVLTVDESSKRKQHFLLSLQKQIEYYNSLYGKMHFDTFYIGGGTPSILSEEEMGLVFDLVHQHFEIDASAEISCELNPEDITESKLECYRSLGVNRISLGVQSFNEQLLKDMGRMHTPEGIIASIQLLKKFNFNNISSDLIIRLPQQTLADVKDSLENLISLNVSQVSVYDLDVHKNTVYGVRQRKGELQLPKEESHRDMAILVDTLLRQAGYEPYELMNYAQKGKESKHNLIYWYNQEYLGLGPGAFSYLNGTRFKFAGNVNQYLSKCDQSEWEPIEQDVLSPEQKEYETLMTRLRLQEGICLKELKLIADQVEPKLEYLIEKKLIEYKQDRICLTRTGRFIFESVYEELLEV